jgi:outer membrane biosynthesis protein TonB
LPSKQVRQVVSINHFLLGLTALFVVYLAGIEGCSTAQKNPDVEPTPIVSPTVIPTPTPTPTPTPPEYTKVVHPERIEITELSRVFLDAHAPKAEDFAEQCTSDFYKLSSIVGVKEEFNQAVRELVRNDPTHYHWCFYARFLNLEKRLTNDTYIDEKQKWVLNEFDFLVPISKAFMAEYHESRYFRWVVLRYQTLSELLFFRKLELTPLGTSELVNAVNPLGPVRESKDAQSILDKYHFIASTIRLEAMTAPIPEVSPTATPSPTPSFTPEPTPTPSPTPEPSPVPSPVPSATPGTIPAG